VRQTWRRGEEDDGEAFGFWDKHFTRGEMAEVVVIIIR
jgi:hypothetical protein